MDRNKNMMVLMSALVIGSAIAWAGSIQAAANKAASSSSAKSATSAKPGASSTSHLPTQMEKTEVEVAPVSPALREAALAAAAKIDALVEGRLSKAGQAPHPLASDEQFVRRTYLNITGAIPTSRQADNFIRAKTDNKRVVLVDWLLGKPGYGSQMYNWMADLLRLVDKADENTYTRPYSDWVKDCLRENRPWDAMVRNMLTAEGRVWDNPAAGFVLRDPNMPLDNLNNAVRIFLGTRIGCAQCHDHPFDRWTQKEFYQLAAFTAGTEYQPPMSQRIKMKPNDFDSVAKDDPMLLSRSRAILRLNRKAVSDNEKKQIHFPHDYQYDNAKPNQVATPAVLWGPSPSAVTSSNRRHALADWVASPDNPRFALTMANRLWQKAMGVGLIEPLDDMKDDTVASNPELMSFLTSELKRLKFNLKEFQRILYYTKTFQRQVSYEDLDPEKPYLFPGPVLRRLTAEQVWDSLLRLTLPDPDSHVRPDDKDYISIVSLSTSATPQQVVQKAKQLAEERKEEKQERSKRSYKGSELMRASELPQPLPDGHFLRQFGQSDRASIATSHTDGTVPQLLTMFNGPVTHMMLEEGSVIYNEVVAEKGMSEQIDRIFLCILSRHPKESEKAAAMREMRAAGPAGYGNVIWALLNTREFLFIQ